MDSNNTTASKVAGKASKRELARSIIRYILVGGSAFILDFGLLWVLVSQLGMRAWLGATIAFIVGMIWSFTLQKIFTFKSHSPAGRAFFRYLILVVANMVITSVVVELFDQVFNLYLVGKVVTTVATTVWSYPLMRRWVYSAPTR